MFFLIDISTKFQHSVDMTIYSVAALDTSTPMICSHLTTPVVLAMGDLATLVVDIAYLVIDSALS